MKYNCNNMEYPNRITSHNCTHMITGETVTRPDGSTFETKPKLKTTTITTKWNNIACGHITSNKDESCNGCKWRVVE